MHCILRLSIISSFLFLFSMQLLAQSDPFELPRETFSLGATNGVAFGDYNNDGYVDIYFSNGNSDAPGNKNWLYLNNGDGTFTKQEDEAGPITSEEYLDGGCAWGDYNNDGYLDMYVANLWKGGSGPSSYAESRLLLNNGDGTFSHAASSDINAQISVSAAMVGWADYNNDGWIDGFASNSKFFGAPATNHSLYSNDQDGTFTEVNNNLTTGISAAAGFSWADFDDDGDMDIIVVSGSQGQNTVLWKNTGSDFTDTTLISSGTNTTDGASWGDYDNDGDLDLILINSGDSQQAPEANILFENIAGKLERITSGAGDIITDVELSQASAWGDYDNDGDLDLFVGNIGGSTTDHESRLYVNNGDGTFTKHSNTNITQNATLTNTAAWGDVDNDGDLDLIVGRDGANQLYENKGNSNSYVHIKVVGTSSNKTAIGTIVRAKATINSEPVWQMREVSSQTGLGSHNDLRVHFGFRDASIIDSLIIKWAGSGNINTYTNISVNQILTYTESAGENHRPTAVDDEATTEQNTPVTINVLNNDSDPDGDNLSVSDVTQGSHGSVANNSSDVTYTPDTDFIGADSFTYVASDGKGGLDTASVYVTVTEPNYPPTAVDDEATTAEDTSVTIDVLNNDSDLNGDTLTVHDVTQGKHGSVIINIDSTVTYTPEADFFGADSFTYVASDGKGGLDTAMVSVTVNNVNDAPEIVGLPDELFLKTNEYEKLKMSEYASDIDTPDSLLSWSFEVSDPAISYDYNEVTDTLTVYAFETTGDFLLFATLTDDSSASDKDTITVHVEFQSALGDGSNSIPKTFTVSQNYPNPFNPITNIQYGIPKTSDVLIEIYNVVGQRVLTLREKNKPAGYHEVQFNGSRLSSGVYFYRVQAGKFNSVKKMILVK